MSGIAPITDEQFQALRATARPYTVVILTPGPNRQSIGAEGIIYQHGMRNAALHLEGIMPVVCPSIDSSEFRGLSIFNASVEEVTELMNGDPAIQAGVLEYQVHAVRSFPGSTLPAQRMPSPRTRRVPPLAVLFWVVIVDYLAQLPYYLVNYYFPHQLAPTLSAVVLLGATLAWFLIGYVGMRRGRAFGYWVLLSFLVVEGLFYLHTLLFGAAVLQMANPNPVVRAVFVIGYVTGIVSLIYAGLLIVFRSRYLRGA